MYNDVGRTEAILKLLASNKWIAKEDADTVALQLEGIVVQVGPYFGYEKISERTYGKSVVQYTYLVKYERQPIKFIFKFYKPNATWNTQSFKYEVDFMDELEESAKGYRLKEN